MNLDRLRPAILPVAAVVVALTIGAVIVAVDGSSPLGAATAIWVAAFSGPDAIGATLEKATPLVFAGLAVIVGVKAGLFNIGAQGQLLVGAITSAYAGYRFAGLSPLVHLPLCLLIGVVFGALPAWLAGVLRAKRGVHEVIVTIMLNTIIFNLTDWLAGGPWMEPGQVISRTPPIVGSARMGRVAGLPTGFVLAMLVTVAVWFMLEHTTFGFRLATVGANRHAAHYAGISVGAVTVAAMTLSGALAGLGGAVESLGVVGRFEPGFNAGLGFDGITIALLARVSPRAVVPAAVFIGALRASSSELQAGAHVAPAIVDVVLGVALLLVAAPLLLRWLLRMPPSLSTAEVQFTRGWGS